jgi:hypothetical protein
MTWHKTNLELFSHHNYKFLSPPRMPEQPVFQAFPPRDENAFADILVVVICAIILLTATVGLVAKIELFEQSAAQQQEK